MSGKISSGMLRAGEWECLKVTVNQLRQDREEGQTPHSNQPDQGPDFQQPQKCRLGLVIQPLIGEISRGCNLPGEFISAELWNNELVSVVIMWEANCYFSWWSWLGPRLEKCICLPRAHVSRGGLCLIVCLFFSWFCFFSATKSAATTATICFCNCSLKASSEKAVLIVRITAQLNRRSSPK